MTTLQIETPHESRITSHSAETTPLALETLIREFAPYIQRLSLTILDDGTTSPLEAQAEADDATQDTFLAASRALPTFRGDASLKTWLTTITVNQCRGRLRKRKTRQRLQTLLTTFQTLLAHPSSPEDTAIQQDTHRRLWAAVDTLDEKHRLPVVMRYVHELPIPEIAVALGLPEGTVHSRLNHARARLKEELEGIQGNT
ncbi:MAG TPA: sigma-70 family RNA polymerase sigma factor [Anaerolineales bacterium]|nr:sigma-70 family RNA polymerase sigma factor [Anaerolineales bacterium]